MEESYKHRLVFIALLLAFLERSCLAWSWNDTSWFQLPGCHSTGLQVPTPLGHRSGTSKELVHARRSFADSSLIVLPCKSTRLRGEDPARGCSDEAISSGSREVC